MYYQPIWQSESLSSLKKEEVGKQTLVLLNAEQEHIHALTAAGYHVVAVKAGDHFQSISRDKYVVNPEKADDYDQLVVDWQKQGIQPDKIIQRSTHQRRGIYTAFYLIKALLFQDIKSFDWIYVYSNDDDTCEHEAMGGFFRSLHAEEPQLQAKIVAIDAKHNFIEQVKKETSTQEDPVVEVRYHGNVRKVRRLNRWDMSKLEKGVYKRPILWRSNGVYIITGGTGGLGLEIADHITKHSQVNLVLVGRSNLNEQTKKRIKRIQKLGSKVLYRQADISKRQETEQLISNVKQQFGHIHGVIHMAGCLHDSFLKTKSKELLDEVLSAKVDGTRWLDEALQTERLDLFVLFSSLMSLIGNVGQVDYAYANRYLDAFASNRMKQVELGNRHGITVAVNWPLWQQGGMTVDKRTVEWMKKVMRIEPLTVTNGVNALDIAIKSGLPQLAVLQGERENVLDQEVGRHMAKNYEMKKLESSHSITNEELLNKTEAYLKEVLSDEIKIPVSKIKSQAPLEEYGIDSVLMVALTRQLEQDFGEISKTLFFEYQTIAELGEYFVNQYRERLLELLVLDQPKPLANANYQEEKEVEQKTVSSMTNSPTNRLTKSRRKRRRRVQRRQRNNKLESIQREEIAIIGVSGRYPQANNLHTYWENLKQGKDSIREVPPERWDWRENFDTNKHNNGSIYTKWGGFMDDIDCFDPMFFNITPKEAELMDPQERLFLETAWHTLEDAGYTRHGLGTQKVGVFVGVMYGQYQLLGVEEGLKGNHVAPSSSYASIANRVSYVMNFHGPSMALDTMCSSSLTAIHLACDSIHKGESTVALAGGVNVSIHPSKYLFLSDGKFASTDGRCRSFGEGGDGYVPGEGTGAVLLKPLNQAIEDGDYIYAVIKGSSLNHGGKTNGYTVPNPNKQAELISAALKNARVKPRDVSYIEAHGTGTELGDPVEISGLVQAFSEAKNDKQFCAIGSVKSNIGHLESAAGIAGLTKILLQMKYKQLVPSIHSESLNPNIKFEQSPFYVQRQLTDWEQPMIQENGVKKALPRIAGISSFGAGGSNAHIILQEWNQHVDEQIKDDEPGEQLIVLSARNRESLQNYAQIFIEFLQEEKDRIKLSDLAYTLQVGREVLNERLALVVRHTDELIEKLTQFGQGEEEIEGVYKSFDKQQSTLDPLLQGETGTLFIESVIQARDWSKLAQFWMSGIDHIPWKQLHAPYEPKRIPLPLYPFMRKRYWIATEGVPKRIQRPNVTAGLHPLIERNASTFNEQRFTTSITGHEFYLVDHRVGDQYVLPGAVYIEMARAAGELSFHQPVKSIQHVVWAAPIVIDTHNEEAQQVSISLYPEGEHAMFEVWTEDKADQRKIHASGEVVYADHYDEADMIDLENIRFRCSSQWEGEACYDLFAKSGLNYGASFQSLVNVHFSAEEAIAELKLPHHLNDNRDEFTLHPTLLDGAFQSIIGILTDVIEGDMSYLPYSIGALDVYDSLTDARYVYAKKVEHKHHQAASERCFGLYITDQQGLVLAVINTFVVKQSMPLQSTQRSSKIDVGLYYPTWIDFPLRLSSTSLEGNILLFDRGTATFDQLNRRLQQQPSKSKMILVQPGTSFNVISEDTYQINPYSKADYLQLFQTLRDRSFDPHHMIHLWSEANIDDTEEGLAYSVYSLLYMVQAIMTNKLNHMVDLTYIYEEQNGQPQPLYAATSGWLKTLVQEYPSIRCKQVALDMKPDKAFKHWFTELTNDRDTMEIRIIEGKRWTKKIEEYTASSSIHSDITKNELVVKRYGTYLITGGTGGLGMMFVKYLAEKANGNIRLLLTGRSPLTADKQTQLDVIQQLGADVKYIQADVSKRQDVNALMSTIKVEYGTLNGVIHSAGVLRDGFILTRQASDMEAVIAPKVHGTILLDEATQHENLDFFVLFSSLSAERGNPGQSDYAYANAFLDAFAHQRKVNGRRGITLSLNWPLWRDGNMGVSEEIERLLEESMPGLIPLSTSNGLAAFETGLISSQPQLIVLEGKKEGMDHLFTPNEKTLREELVGDNEEPQDQELDHHEIENYLKSILSQETKLELDHISSTEPLEEYGINSVMVMNMTRVLEEDFGNLSKTLFFEYQTIRELVDYFAQHHAPKVAELFKSSQSEKQSTVMTEENEPKAQSPQTLSRSRSATKAMRGLNHHEVNHEEIAIIGLSGRYPMADDVHTLWEHLKAGKDCITEIPSERWDHEHFFDENKQSKGKTYSKWGGFINDVDKFDPLVFNISPREAKLMDPQERLFLQTIWHTMEDAGYTKAQFNERQVGVFVGAMYAHYQMIGANYETTGQDIPASSFASIANRVSYVFDFHGPSIAMDTMCSSSLTAIHLACKSIQLGESDVAFAGGVNVSIHPHKYLVLGQSKFASSDGRCRAFGEGGDGYVPGEGVGAVLLKPLRKAIEDGDHIYGVIKASAINHGGKTNGYYVPNPNYQAHLIAETLQKANIDPRHMSYIETHGTGTSLGDPIEITGLHKAFEQYTRDKGFCAIGSIKSNIGHLESAAGIAGLTKVLLQFKHQQLVPSIHTDTLNPNINFSETPFYVQRELSEWEQQNKPRLAGLSSFGAGGSNAHLIIEEWLEPQDKSEVVEREEPQLIVLSAKNEARLKEHAQRIAYFLGNDLHVDEAAQESNVFKQLMNEVRQMTADVINVNVKEIALDEMFNDYGFDHVMIAQLAQHLSKHFQVDVDEQIIYDYPHVRDLATYLWETRKNEILDYYGMIPSYHEQTNILQNNASLRDIAYTLQVGREAMEERLAVIVNSKEELYKRLKQYVEGHIKSDMFVGTVKKGNNRLQLFDEDEDSRDLMRKWVSKGKLDKLALLWINGVEVDWTQMPMNNEVRRISLPVYPFARERYWIDHPHTPLEMNDTTISSPLIDKIDSHMSFTHAGMAFIKTITPQSALVNDHCVQGERMLPGVAYLEMVLEACRQVEPESLFELEQVVWMKPIIVRDQPKDIRVFLRESGQKWTFNIESGHSEDVVIHATGNIYIKDKHDHHVMERISITTLQSESTVHLDQQDVYRRFEEIGLQYGHYFQTIHQLWGNEKESLSELKLPKIAQEEGSSYILPPSLLDGSLQTILGITDGDSQQHDTLVPFAIEQVIHLRRLPMHVFAYATRRTDNIFDVFLTDEQGNVCTQLIGVSVRTITVDNPTFVSQSQMEAPIKSQIIEEKTDVINNVDKQSFDIKDLEAKVKQTVKDALVDVLQINSQEFDDMASFTDFGVDSVLAVEIINQVNETLNIQLRTTDLFNYVSIRQLTDYILEEFSDDIRVVPLPQVTNITTNYKSIVGHQQVSHVKHEFKQARQLVDELESYNENTQRKSHVSDTENVSSDHGEIAIVGMSGQFPGANNLDEFWENLINGTHSVEVASRWETKDFYSSDRTQADKSYSKWMGQLEDIDKFDPLFFNISPKEAEHIDPQQRLFLMEAWRALEDAGYTEIDSETHKCGVFVGCGSGDYMDVIKEHNASPSAYAFMGNDESILPARISYFLNLKGPSIAINTACSSSLVAVHLACESIRTGTSDMALAGGISILNTPRVHVLASRAGMLSPDGQCKAFDNNANGFVPSEGVGVVVLKRLEDALNDGDHIYGIIKGSAINQDGQTNGITAPSAPAQTELELDVYNNYQINPAHISYVEAHGTGTKLGDPIEVDALTDAFRQYTKDTQYCAIGSVKSNIGHALPAAGIAGLLKILLSLKYKQLPPSLLVERENEHIPFDQTPFYVNTELKDWKPTNDNPRRMAAISSFGFSGTNAHMVIEEAPSVNTQTLVPHQAYMIPISAKTETALKQKLNDLLHVLDKADDDQIPLQHLAYTLHMRRSHFAIRATFVTTSLDDLRSQVQTVITSGQPYGYYQHNLDEHPIQPVPQRKEQGEKLLDQIGVDLRQHVDNSLTNLNLLAKLYTEGYDLSWHKLYIKGDYQHLSLPTYPFDLQRCWISNESSNSHGQRNQIVVDQSYTMDRLVERHVMSPHDRIVHDHQIYHKKIFPGVGYLQLAYHAIQNAGFTKDVTLKDVLWLKPLVIGEQPVELKVHLDTEDDQMTYTFISEVNGETTVHAKGQFETSTLPKQESLPLQEIQKRCTSVVTGEELYRRLAAIGMTYGPYFQGVQNIWSHSKEVLGYLQLASDDAQDLIHLPIHPGLMDAALHTISGFIQSEKPLFPFAVDRIEVYRPLEKEAYAYATQVGKHRFDITLTDTEGVIGMTMDGVTFVSDDQPSPKHDFYYQPSWSYTPLQTVEDLGNRHEQTVLMIHPSETDGLHQALAAEHAQGRILHIQFGEQTRQHSTSHWEIDPTDGEVFDTIFAEWEDIDTIYFMGGLRESKGVTDLSSLENSQQKGVMSLFRLVKAMTRNNSVSRSLTLKVITNNVFSVLPGEKVYPASASLHGFTKSLSKEYPNWNVKFIDVSLREDVKDQTNQTTLSQLAEMVVTERAQLGEEEIAIRQGKRYTQQLEQVQLPPANSFPFKEGGCYLILGGAGGIGMELSKYISEHVQANLVLIGRSPLDEKRKRTIEHIKRKGSDVLYIQADALDLDSMQQAIIQTKERFGTINGVIHSAIVLRDRIIENMDEKDLRVALNPKVHGSYILHRVLEDEPLDFLLFFSSAQSFSGNPGQSNYAAGCTFKDAFAHYLMQTVPYPVRIINWGYWGTVGVVSSDDYNERLGDQGVQSIHPEEGMEAVVCILSNRLQQVVPFKAEKQLLERLGIDMEHKITLCPDRPKRLNKLINILEAPTMHPSRVQQITYAFDQLGEFGSWLLLDAFKRMGVFQQEGEHYSYDNLAKKLSIIPKYRQLLEACVNILHRAEFINVTGKTIIVTDQATSPNTLQKLSQLETSHQQLVSDHPDVRAHVNLIWTCLTHFPNIIQGTLPATDVMFPNSSMDLVENIYGNNDMADFYNKLVVWSLQTYLQHEVEHLASDRKIKILEIGAGTGGTSAHVFEGMQPYAEHVSYVYTDISPGFITYGQRKFGSQYPYVQFEVLDIEKDVADQGFALGAYDLIIATNVLHATSHLRQTLGHIKSLLKTNGWLVINETTEVHDFATLTFGLLDGWWLYEDDERRLPDSPLVNPISWEQVCKEVGYEHVKVLGELGLGQNVVIAESNGLLRQRTDKVRSISHDVTGPIEMPSEGEVKRLPLSTNVVETDLLEEDMLHLQQSVEQLICNSINKQLGILTTEINKDKDFSAYGIDSISGVELINHINDQLGILLRTTVLFDYKTVHELATYICEKYRDDVSKTLYVQTTTMPDGDIPNENGQLVDDDHLKLEHYIMLHIIQSIEETLGIEANDIHLEKSFSSYGIDSISGVDVINKINDRLNIVLRTTTLFDYSNVKELTEHIYQTYGGQLKEELTKHETATSEVTEASETHHKDLLEKLATGELSINEVISLWR